MFVAFWDSNLFTQAFIEFSFTCSSLFRSVFIPGFFGKVLIWLVGWWCCLWHEMPLDITWLSFGSLFCFGGEKQETNHLRAQLVSNCQIFTSLSYNIPFIVSIYQLYHCIKTEYTFRRISRPGRKKALKKLVEKTRVVSMIFYLIVKKET